MKNFKEFVESKYPLAKEWQKGASKLSVGPYELVRGKDVHKIKENGREIGSFWLEDMAGWVISLKKNKGEVYADEIDDFEKVISGKA